MTGTPLQNNMGELFTLLSMFMPDVFTDKELFENWFSFEDDKDSVQAAQAVQCLHRIMRPFMLRRSKKDLEFKLPDKIEMNISLPMS